MTQEKVNISGTVKAACKWLGIGACLFLLIFVTYAVYALEPEEEFQKKLEELADDPSLPREERIRRHREKLSLILKRRQAEKEEDQRRQKEEASRQIQIQREVETVRTAPPEQVTLEKIKGAIGSLLSIEPFNINAEQGEEFFTKIVLTDYNEQPLEEIRISLTYDKRYLKPLNVYDFAINTFLSQPPVFQVNENLGSLEYDGTFSQPRRFFNRTPILFIKWQAIQDITGTNIEFSLENNGTALISNGEDYLGTPHDPSDGVISAGVNISSAKDERKAYSYTALKDRSIPLDYFEQAGSFDPVGLQLVSSHNHVVPDQEFIVNIMLLNPTATMIDDIALYIRFDAEMLEAIDYDKGNWIRRGVNIGDGFAHEVYNFDFHKMNQVDNDEGVIKYWMGLSEPQPLPTGILAKIKFRAKQENNVRTLIHFDYTDEKVPLTTDIRYLGVSVLDRKSVINCRVALLMNESEHQ